jgi:hypothetical protein
MLDGVIVGRRRSPSVQVTKDNDGRPIALAAMHPEVAYNALATRIIEAYDRAVGNPE